MYKGAAEARDSITRTGSAATKGSARGDLKIPHGIALVDDLAILHRRDALLAEWRSVNDQIEKTDLVLTRRHDFATAQKLKEKRKELGRRAQGLQEQIHHIRSEIGAAKEAAARPWERVFIRVVKHYLPHDVWIQLRDKTSELLSHIAEESAQVGGDAE